MTPHQLALTHTLTLNETREKQYYGCFAWAIGYAERARTHRMWCAAM